MTVTIRANRAYPSLPSAGGGLVAHTRLLEALKEAVEVHERRVPNAYLDSFVRLGELVELGILQVQGDRIESAFAGGTGTAIDHGTLGGLEDDDHPQYLLVANAAEAAQDAVGNILLDSSSIDFTYDDSTPSITATVLPGGVDHDQLLNFVADEHVDHSSVEIQAGTGLTGGGDLTQTRSLALDQTTLDALALAATAVQPGDNISDLVNDVGYITDISAFSIGDLSDVDIGTPGSGEDGYALVWDNGEGVFVLADVSGGGGGGLPPDPDADAVLGWVDSNGQAEWLELATDELVISGTTLGVGDNVPLKDAPNAFTVQQTIQRTGGSLSLTVERTDNTANAVIEAKTTGGSVYFGNQNGSTFAIGASSNLTSSPWVSVSGTEFEVNATLLDFNGNADISGTLAVGGTITGNGSGLTSLNASNLSSGTVPSDRLPVYATRWPSWSEVTSKPSTFPPESHTHSWSQLTGEALIHGPLTIGDGSAENGADLLTLASSRSWKFTTSGTGSDTRLVLKSNVASKRFEIVNSDGQQVASFFAAATPIVSMPRLQLEASNDASLTSTAHALQIGPTNGANLIIDNNEMMSRNNGEAATLSLNFDGGNVNLSNTGYLTHVRGDLRVSGLVAHPMTFGAQQYLQFANEVAQKINLYSTTYGIGVESNTAYFRSNRYFRWYNAAADGGASDHMQLDCNSGNLWVRGNVTAFSDRRVKDDIVVIPDALEKVRRLSGYTFRRTDMDIRQAGVIAQEVQEVLPEVVTVDDQGYLSVAYGNLVALLIEAIKELDRRVS